MKRNHKRIYPIPKITINNREGDPKEFLGHLLYVLYKSELKSVEINRDISPTSVPFIYLVNPASRQWINPYIISVI